MATTLKTLVLKTAMVKSVKLGTPADRIGLGRVVAAYPADVLSPRPSNSGGHRQALSAMRMHEAETALAEPPAGSAGRDSSGSSAHRWPASFAQQCETKRPLSRASFPAIPSPSERKGDCQSPDRRDGGEIASTRETTPAAAAAI